MMSGNKSRLGKGLGALFPALPGEDTLVDSVPNLQENVSHETAKRSKTVLSVIAAKKDANQQK